MRILVAHNRYQQPGGEDVVFRNEVDLLSRSGHDVRTLEVYNRDVVSMREKARALLGTVRNESGIAAVSAAIATHRPDVAHFHNTFPLISPAAYGVCHAAGVAVVQTLHNFRPICVGSLLLRDGRICMRCVDRSPLPGVVHRCYRGSFVASAAAARMLAVHRARGTWAQDVDRYIALSAFCRDTFISGGLPAERIDVKPNFMPDPGPPEAGVRRSGILYVGRLSLEKGVATLIEASAELDCEVRVVGTGPEMEKLKARARGRVTFLGALGHSSVIEEMRRACAVVAPSIWCESFPMIVLEAFACGTPVVASRLGALAEIVEDDVTGRLVPPNDAPALRVQLASLVADPLLVARLGAAARKTFVDRYTPETNLRRLEEIYRGAMGDSASRTTAAKGRNDRRRSSSGLVSAACGDRA